MSSKYSEFGHLVTEYLWFIGKTQTDLATEISLHRNKLGQALQGKYHMKREYLDAIIEVLAKWGVKLTEEDRVKLRDAWERDQERWRSDQRGNVLTAIVTTSRWLHKHIKYIKQHHMQKESTAKVSGLSETPCKRGACPMISHIWPPSSSL